MLWEKDLQVTRFNIREVRKTGYLFPCSCNRLPTAIGTFNIRDDDDKLLYSYTCCPGCKLPITQVIATKVNFFLGNKPEEIEIDQSFMETLYGIDTDIE